MNKFYASITMVSLIASLSLGMDEKAKTGFFGGLDLSVANYHYSDLPDLAGIASSSASGAKLSEVIVGPQSRSSFNYGLKGGYQFYFTPKHGVRATIHFLMGNYNGDQKAMISPTSGGGGTSTSGISISNTGSVSYFGLRYGVSVDYLYDFYNSDKSAIGLSAGFGYELANYVGGKAKNVATTPLGDKITEAKNSLFGTGTYLNLGTHYYFTHSQIEFGLKIPFNTFGSDSYVANGATKNTSVDPKTSKASVGYEYGFLTVYPSVHLNYTYRF
ncbi:outer membrane beta-barrel protein [Helicobacter sp. 11S03491-1]|uniref:outer membrane beta-barrel protein n=1 Tax=Helicobacter sp. 11S03491-1 TaxID=1476196 RepID=UPI000BA557F6|nr:outer membrane beta-barrel protein [Helicobacter sp. 11S03491-1]PAF41115.1 hypothetical protein BKH45_08295 [Helicobacter sp. 11S03491-1]